MRAGLHVSDEETGSERSGNFPKVAHLVGYKTKTPLKGKGQCSMKQPLVFPSRETESPEVVTSSLFLVLRGARPLLALGPA